MIVRFAIVATVLTTLTIGVWMGVSLILALVISWLVTLISPLTFAQAALLTTLSIIVFEYILTSSEVLTVFTVAWMVLVGVPIFNIVNLGAAWLVGLITPLTFWESALMTGGLGLIAIVSFFSHLSDVDEMMSGDLPRFFDKTEEDE